MVRHLPWPICQHGEPRGRPQMRSRKGDHQVTSLLRLEPFGHQVHFPMLGQIASIKSVGLILNIGEQLLDTILQTFPESMLPEYLPRVVEVRQPHRGLVVGHAYDDENDMENRWQGNEYAKTPRERDGWVGN
jgi:hypothetical protein